MIIWRAIWSMIEITVEGVVPPSSEYCVLWVVGGAGEGGGSGDPDVNPNISIPAPAIVVSGGSMPPWLKILLLIPSIPVSFARWLYLSAEARVVWPPAPDERYRWLFEETDETWEKGPWSLCNQFKTQENYQSVIRKLYLLSTPGFTTSQFINLLWFWSWWSMLL